MVTVASHSVSFETFIANAHIAAGGVTACGAVMAVVGASCALVDICGGSGDRRGQISGTEVTLLTS